MEHIAPLPRVLLEGRPTARALVRGGEAYPDLVGELLFYPYQSGTLLLARVAGLPGAGFFGFHIHEGGSCATGGDISFLPAGGHYNPEGRQHPEHAGDLPVLLSAGGQALLLCYTDRFLPGQVIGRTAIIHAAPDDFRSQPAGDSGRRIACGVIEANP